MNELLEKLLEVCKEDLYKQFVNSKKVPKNTFAPLTYPLLVSFFCIQLDS